MNVYWTEAKNLELFCPQSSGHFIALALGLYNQRHHHHDYKSFVKLQIVG